jgi:hypothetical protein
MGPGSADGAIGQCSDAADGGRSRNPEPVPDDLRALSLPQIAPLAISVCVWCVSVPGQLMQNDTGLEKNPEHNLDGVCWSHRLAALHSIAAGSASTEKARYSQADEPEVCHRP